MAEYQLLHQLLVAPPPTLVTQVTLLWGPPHAAVNHREVHGVETHLLVKVNYHLLCFGQPLVLCLIILPLLQYESVLV